MQKILRTLTLAAGGVAIGAFVGKLALRQSRHFEWSGKRVVVAGGSRGLGLVIARQLIDQGARVAICARSADDLTEAYHELSERLNQHPGGQVASATCDITQPDQVTSFISQVANEFGGIDVLINTAAIIQVGPWESMTENDFRLAMDVNCWGAFNLAKAISPIMQRQQWGRILNVASIGAQQAVPHMSPYVTSKFALLGFSSALRTELAKDNVLVTTVCPSLMRTGSPPNAIFKGQHRKEYAWFSISDAMPVISIKVEEAAAKILQACQDGDAVVSLYGAMSPLVHLARLAPNWTLECLGLVNRYMPSMGGIGQRSAKGRDSESKLTRTVLPQLGDSVTVRNNED